MKKNKTYSKTLLQGYIASHPVMRKKQRSRSSAISERFIEFPILIEELNQFGSNQITLNHCKIHDPSKETVEFFNEEIFIFDFVMVEAKQYMIHYPTQIYIDFHIEKITRKSPKDEAVFSTHIVKRDDKNDYIKIKELCESVHFSEMAKYVKSGPIF